MSGTIFSDINPSTTSGSDLATALNLFKDAVASGFSGTARPSNLQAGGYWVDTTLAASPDYLWKYMMWTGTVDVLVFSVNINTNTILIAGTTGTYTISQTSADAVGPILKLLKKRVATNGQTLIGDSLGEVQFDSTDDLGATVISARIKAVANNNTTSSQAGAYLVFEEIDTNSGTITEKMRLKDGNLGVGQTAPTTAIHIKSLTGFTNERVDDSATGPTSTMKKSRVSGSGQVLSGDSLGKYNFKSTDNAGADIDSAVVIEGFATQNHTSTAQGSKVTVGVKKTGATTVTEKMSIGDVLNFPEGHQTKNEIIGSSGTAASNVKLHRSAAGKLTAVLGDDATAEGSEPSALAQFAMKHESFTNAGKPSFGQFGRVIWISDLSKLQYDTGSAWVDVGSLANPMTAGGDIIYGGPGGTATRLANGSAGQVLQSGGGTAAPSWTSSPIVPYASKSANYTATLSDEILVVNATSGNITITLPAASGNTGKKYTIKKSDATVNQVIIDGNASETVEGATTFSLYNQNDRVEIVCTGSGWEIINLSITKESVICTTTTATYSQTANTWITVPITSTSDSTRYPVTSNTITIRKTARYRLICKNSFNGVNGEVGYVTYSVNGASESSNYINGFQMDSNASGSSHHVFEAYERSFTAGDVLRLRAQMATNTRTGNNGRLELLEL